MLSLLGSCAASRLVRAALPNQSGLAPEATPLLLRCCCFMFRKGLGVPTPPVSHAHRGLLLLPCPAVGRPRKPRRRPPPRGGGLNPTAPGARYPSIPPALNLAFMALCDRLHSTHLATTSASALGPATPGAFPQSPSPPPWAWGRGPSTEWPWSIQLAAALHSDMSSAAFGLNCRHDFHED
jgi:hypothetical protein